MCWQIGICTGVEYVNRYVTRYGVPYHPRGMMSTPTLAGRAETCVGSRAQTKNALPVQPASIDREGLTPPLTWGRKDILLCP